MNYEETTETYNKTAVKYQDKFIEKDLHIIAICDPGTSPG